MKHTPWTNPNFLLSNEIAKELFHTVAKDLPVVDYHNHISTLDLSENRKFENITQLWLSSDPYKHRLMRICGVAEENITGTASDRQKFGYWAQTLPKALGNPLFHWSGLELRRVFDIHEMLCPENAERIWQQCNEKLQDDAYRILPLVRCWNVERMCTSDDLLADLSPHQQVSEAYQDLDVRPSLRADALLAFDKPNFHPWLHTLTQQTGITIHSLEDYQEAILHKLDHFSEARCLLADHALDPVFYFELPSEQVAAVYFMQVLDQQTLTKKESFRLQSFLLHFLAKAYAEKEWILQLHIGAQRQTSSRLKKLAGGAGGYACIGNTCDIDSLCRFLDSVEQSGKLPRIILYTLNPADYEPLASLTGSFAEDGVPGKIQLGPAWWYNDHYQGIKRHLKILANYGVLSLFIGMTTDSRSPLSFSRHEYFRRILCNTVGHWVEKGHLPADQELLRPLIRDISYQNAAHWIFNQKIIDEKPNIPS